MTPNPTASTPASPWVGRLHLALTTALFAAAVSIAGLAVAGRVKFGGAAETGTPKGKGKAKARASANTEANANAYAEDESRKTGGRYQIHKVDAGRQLLQCLGGTDFFEKSLVDSWVFEYKGGLVEAKLETDFEGRVESPGKIPVDWKQFLRGDESLKRDPSATLERSGFIVVSAIRPVLPLDESLPPYYPHLGGLLAFGPLGPVLHAAPILFLEVNQPRLYRVLVSSNPSPNAPDNKFIVSSLQSLRVQTLLVPRDPAEEKGQTGGGDDLRPGTDEILLDRQRGHSRFRLVARFLTDGEAREVLPK